MVPLKLINSVARNQLPSGQFPTLMRNVEENWQRQVGTLTPTYLVCLLLSLYRERHQSHAIIDRIISRCLDYVESRCYYDPIEGYRVWHFNCFYPPDWEEICWCTWMLCEAKRINRRELEALYRLIRENETEENGIGVWIRHPYSEESKYKNAFDGFVDLSITFWLKNVFRTCSAPTDALLTRSIAANNLSRYYFPDFARFFFSLFGHFDPPAQLPSPDAPLFHQGSRRQVQYFSPDVWLAAKLFV
ncbi:MAG: hypothetical protein V1668_01415 [Patescibacteria group bacterium]